MRDFDVPFNGVGEFDPANAAPPNGEVVNPEAAPKVLALDPVTTVPAEEDGEVEEPSDAEQSPELDETKLVARYGFVPGSEDEDED